MSTEYIAILAGAISFILKYFKIDIGSEEITNTLTLVVGAISAVYLLVKRYKRGGITPLGFRK